MKAVFNRPEKTNPMHRDFEIRQCLQAHYRPDSHQLATSVAFLHLTVDQLRRLLPTFVFSTIGIAPQASAHNGRKDT